MQRKRNNLKKQPSVSLVVHVQKALNGILPYVYRIQVVGLSTLSVVVVRSK